MIRKVEEMDRVKMMSHERYQRMVSLLLACVMVLGMILGTLVMPSQAIALPDADDAIWNYPSRFADWQPGDPTVMSLNDLEMSEPPSIIHSFYDSDKFNSDSSAWAYTPATSRMWNGFSTPDHAVLDGDAVRFLGYGVDPFMDMVFYKGDVGRFESISFVLQPIVMNFHTFSESGLLFNGSFNGQHYTGYALLLKNGNMQGMINDGAAQLSLIYIDNEKMDGNSYNPGTLASTRTLIATYKTGIETLTTPTFDITIDKYPTGNGFMLYLDGQLVQDVPDPKSVDDGFGFFTGYYRHNCTILTVMEFSQIAITMPGDTPPKETYPTVKFVDLHSREEIVGGVVPPGMIEYNGYAYTEIANPQTQPINPTFANDPFNSYFGDLFRVTPPSFIDEYRYVSASRNALDPIRYSFHPASNEIILFYESEIGVLKSSLAGTSEDAGTPENPIPVSMGAEFDYSIDIVNPGASRGDINGLLSFGETVISLATGAAHTVALTSAGDVYVWGLNTQGQLGLGDTIQRDTPVKHQGLSASGSSRVLAPGETVASLVAGSSHTLVLTSVGDVYVWGINSGGQLGLGDTTQRDTPVKHQGLSASGSSRVLAPGETVASFAASGSNSSLTLTSAGDVYVWGLNASGKLGLGDSVQRDTPVKHQGLSASGSSRILAPGETITLFSGENTYTLALTSAGDVYAWGAGMSGQLGVGSPHSNSSPFRHEMLSASGSSRILAPGEIVTSLASGLGHTLALTSAGDVYVWGLNANNQLGLGDGSTRFSPVKHEMLSASGNSRILAPGEIVTSLVSLRANSSFVLTSLNDVYVWGFNSSGQLGLGDVVQRPAPVNNEKLRSFEPFIISDLIPEGLSLVIENETPVYDIVDENGVAVSVGDFRVTNVVESGRDRITLEFKTLPHGVTRFIFKVSVDSPSNPTFINQASFYDPTTDETHESNETYHATANVVTEKYQAWGSGDAVADDTLRGFGAGFDDAAGDPYSPYPYRLRPIMDSNGDMWRLVGYQRIGVDGSPILGHPPMGMQWDADEEIWIGDGWCFDSVTGDEDIIFFFAKDIRLTIDYKDDSDRGGANIKNRFNAAVPGMQNYFMPVSHMAAFDTWNYANAYSLDGGATVLTGNPPMPTYSATQMAGDQHIIIYFTQDPVVTVQYREYNTDPVKRSNSQLLFDVNGVNREAFVLDGSAPYSFDPMDQSSISDTVNGGATSFSGHGYPLYRGYSVDGGVTVILGEPPVLTGITDTTNLILYFSTQYPVIEKFQANDRTHNSDATTLKADVVTDVWGGEPFTGNAPRPTFVANGFEWHYIGWVMDKQTPDFTGVDPADYGSLVDGVTPPTIDEVNAPGITVIYLYQKGQPVSLATVTERFREYGNTGNVLSPDRSTDVAIGSPVVGNPKDLTSDKWLFYGYQIDGGPIIIGEVPLGVIIASLDGSVTITYLYSRTIPPEPPKPPQPKPWTIRYYPGTTDKVFDLPFGGSFFADTKVTVDHAPVRLGHRFLGYHIETVSAAESSKFRAGTRQPFSTFTMPAAHLKATALWQKVWPVTFHPEGGTSVPGQTVDGGGTAKVPTPPTREGYEFLGWYFADGTPYDFNTPVTGPVDLYARWRPIATSPATGDATIVHTALISSIVAVGLLVVAVALRKRDARARAM